MHREDRDLATDYGFKGGKVVFKEIPGVNMEAGENPRLPGY
jgi:hypothetical protein